MNSASDDAIVVIEVEKGVCSMEPAVQVLREKLGDDAMLGLRTLVDDAGRQWKDDVLAIAAERFERRLGEEIGAFRVEVAKQFADFRVDIAKEFAAARAETAKEFAAVRAETAKEFAAVRAETAKEFAALRVELATGLAETRASLIKWSFLFWVGQLATMTGIMALLLRTIVPR